MSLKPNGDEGEKRPLTPSTSIEKSPRFMRKKEVFIVLTVVIRLLHNAGKDIPKAEYSHTPNSAKRSVICIYKSIVAM